MFATKLHLLIFVGRMKKKLANWNWDAIGVTATLACAIHCALLPMFLSSLPLFGMDIINNETFEAGMILLAFGIGMYSLLHGYRKHHHKIFPILIFITGFSFLVVKEFFNHTSYWLLIPAVIGIITAHLMNYKYCRAANHCHKDDCNH